MEFGMPPKNKISWGEDFFHTRSPPQPSIPTAKPSSTVAENGPTSSSSLTLMPSTTNFSNILTPGGYFAGTWTYIPPGAAVPTSSSTRAITAAEDSAAQEPAAEEPAAPAQLADLRLPLNPVCSVCDQEVENMQTVQDVGNVCLACLCHNTRRA